MKKIWLFRLIAISIPLVLFIIIEFSLRLSGYGHYYSLFIENPDAPQYLLPRPDIVKRYFAEGSVIPTVTIETNFFKKKKPQNGIRIFVQGGSTAAGFPFGYGASIAGMLDYRLKKTFPDRSVEVVNTALAAVNSFTMLDFSDEIIAQQPDAVLIYAGHNEFLGILGVGSAYSATNSYWATRLFLLLKQFRIFQFLQNTYSSLTKNDSDILLQQQKSRTFMAKVARNKNIPKNSDVFKQGLFQFKHNLISLIEKYQDAEIPVFIATIGSNLKDQKPFFSNLIPENIRKQHISLFKAIKNKKITPQQISLIEKLAENYTSADLYYFLGQYYFAMNNFEKSRLSFIAARDHDLLRFRAPSEINQIISTLANDYNLKLVDVNSALNNNAVNGIIGNGLMLEHLHPTLKGYFIISDSFYQSLRKSKIFGNFPYPVTTDTAESEIPVFPAEEYWGKAKIAALMADYPFTEKPSRPHLPPLKSWDDRMGFAAYKHKSSWLDIAIQTIKRSTDKPAKLAFAAKLLADALPHRADYSYQAGVLLIRNKQAIEAPRYLLRAINIEPDNVNNQLALSHAYTAQKRYKDALPWLNSILKMDPSNKIALAAKQQIVKITSNKQ